MNKDLGYTMWRMFEGSKLPRHLMFRKFRGAMNDFENRTISQLVEDFGSSYQNYFDS